MKQLCNIAINQLDVDIWECGGLWIMAHSFFPGAFEVMYDDEYKVFYSFADAVAFCVEMFMLREGI